MTHATPEGEAIRQLIERMGALGVDGVITDDPRLFESSPKARRFGSTG